MATPPMSDAERVLGGTISIAGIAVGVLVAGVALADRLSPGLVVLGGMFAAAATIMAIHLAVALLGAVFAVAVRVHRALRAVSNPAEPIPRAVIRKRT